ncbi:hypothetical protein JCM19241_3081 [Vibrio ishigakensis]|uniref:Uncharacterized protein n=1 Tax=Vibrio ishigakensis TaxID=1481914 RepID=A0A0B8Q519_9VIBR|nr:hypothetical protein JCM19241_3081 [Vibrio ishigakensis]
MIHPETDEYFSGTFVVGDAKGGKVLITAWRNDIETEYYLSAVMKLLRKQGELTTQDLLRMHPRYQSKDLTSHADLVQALSENKSAKQIGFIQQQADLAVAEAHDTISSLEQKNDQLSAKVAELKQQGELKDLEVRLVQTILQSQNTVSSNSNNGFWKGISLALALAVAGFGGWFAYHTTASNSVESVASAPAPKTAVTTDEAIQYEGSSTTVCGKVVQITDFNKGSYLNFDKVFPQTQFTAVIWNSDLRNVTQDQSLYTTYSNQEVCVTGLVGSYKGRAQIVVKNPAQMSIH